MNLVLRALNSGTLPNNQNEVAMKDGVLTIGRGEENDLSLPDPDRLLSKRHCVLEERNGDYVIIDTSTNGTYLNYGTERIGNIPTPISHGDVLQLGGFELIVEIYSDAAPSQEPLPPAEDSLALPNARLQEATPTDLDDPLDNGSEPWDSYFDEPLDGPSPDATPSALARSSNQSDPLDWKDPLDAGAPIGADDLLGPSRGSSLLGDFAPPAQYSGSSAADHSRSEQDYFPAPSVQSSMIPDDWDSPLTSHGVSAQAPEPETQIPPAQSSAPDAISGFPESDPLDDFLKSEPDDLSGGISGPFDTQEPASSTPPAPAAEAQHVPPRASPVPQHEQSMQDVPTPAQIPASAPPPAPAPAATPASAQDAAMRAFLTGSGADHLKIPEDEILETMERMGSVFAAMVTGMREILMARASIKSEMRMNRTMVGSGENNPLKFSISPEQAVEAMIRPSVRGYLDAETATIQAFGDIRAHELAMMSGMEAALKDLLVRLDPAQLSTRIETGSSLGGLLGGKKAKYWEAYEKMYSQISRETEDDFQSTFGREFIRAYEDQLKKL